jgi:hypothetical protein
LRLNGLYASDMTANSQEGEQKLDWESDKTGLREDGDEVTVVPLRMQWRSRRGYNLHQGYNGGWNSRESICEDRLE